MTDYSKLITDEVEMLPPIICIYGVGGIGKTTLACSFPKPIIIRTEDGASQLPGVGKLPRVRSIQELEDQLDFVIHGEHKYKTLILDSIDEVQNLKNKAICWKHGVEDVLELGFGKGTGPLRSYFNLLREKLDEVRERGLIVIVVSHSIASTFKDPLGDDYSTYTLALDEKIVPKIKDWTDATLFINNKVLTREAGKSFGKEVKKPISKGGRPKKIIYTEERPGFLAKNRYDLPAEMELYDNDPKKTANEILGLIRECLMGRAGKNGSAAKKKKLVVEEESDTSKSQD